MKPPEIAPRERMIQLPKVRKANGHSLVFVARYVETSPTTIRNRERETSSGEHPWIDAGIDRYIDEFGKQLGGNSHKLPKKFDE